MSELKEYTVDIGGLPHTLLLSAEDAAKRGLTKTATKAGSSAVEQSVEHARKARKPRAEHVAVKGDD